jgi:hypothetical protein
MATPTEVLRVLVVMVLLLAPVGRKYVIPRSIDDLEEDITTLLVFCCWIILLSPLWPQVVRLIGGRDGQNARSNSSKILQTTSHQVEQPTIPTSKEVILQNIAFVILFFITSVQPGLVLNYTIVLINDVIGRNGIWVFITGLCVHWSGHGSYR